MKRRKIAARICAFLLAVSLIAADTLPTFAAEVSKDDGLIYKKGELYNGYYMDKKGVFYIVSDGEAEPKSGTVSEGRKYYNSKKEKMMTLSKQTVYVSGKVYTGYYLSSVDKMYTVKKGTKTLKAGTLDVGTKYYSYNAEKTKTLSKKTVYVDGKLYTGYYMSSGKKMYRAKKGKLTLINTTFKDGTKYYSYNAGKKQTLSKKTVYVNGKAVKGMSAESLATLQRAQAVVNDITDDSMTKKEKLKVCFDFVKTYKECRPRTPHYTGMDWPVIYANDMFVDGTGNCCSYAAAFAYMAKAIGYEEVYCCNSGGHGWAEVDGLIYDPEWSLHHKEYSYYALSYNTKMDQNYKGAIAAGQPWMHVKI